MQQPKIHRLKPIPYIHSQSRVADPKRNIHAAPEEADKSDYLNLRTVNDLLNHCFENFADKPCFGTRRDFSADANWKTYSQVGKEVDSLGCALSDLVETTNGPNMFIGIYGKNSAEWVCTQCACARRGLVVVPLYDTFGADALKHIVEQTELRIIICDTVDRARFILKWAKSNLNQIIVIEGDEDELQSLNEDTHGSPEVFTYKELLIRGSEMRPEVKEVDPKDLFLLCYTSGTTGFPKGVMHTHHSFIRAILSSFRVIKITGISELGNVHISYLPLSHIMEQLLMFVGLMTGTQVAFLTNNLTGLMKDIFYYRPTIFCAVPRVMNRVYNEAVQNMKLNCFTKPLYKMALKVKYEEQTNGIFRQSGLLDRFFFREIRRQFGGRVRFVLCGSAPLQSDVLQFAKAAFSCPFVEIYGSTEAGGVVTMTLPTDFHAGHAGSIAAGVEIKLIDVPSMEIIVRRDGLGEVCVRSDACTTGYFRDEVQTSELLDEDGFLHTGDIAHWTKDGALKIVDRCKNMFKLAQGEYVAPEKVEQVYQMSPLVINVFVDGKALYSYAVAVVVPNFNEIHKRFASQLPDLFGNTNKDWTLDDLNKVEACKNRQLNMLMLKELNKIGTEKGLKGFEQVRAIHLHPEPFSEIEALLTPTMKVSRPQARKKFTQQLQALYDGRAH